MSTLPHMDRRELLAIFAGGALSAALAWRSRIAHRPRRPRGPGRCSRSTSAEPSLLGYVVTRLQERRPLSTYRRPLLGTGFCGAYTTFSTMQLELLKMVDHHRYGLALGYALAAWPPATWPSSSGPLRRDA